MRESVVRCIVREDQTIRRLPIRETDHLPPRSPRWPKAVGVTLVGFVVACALVAAVAPLLQPKSPVLGNDIRKVAAALIFAASYLALAVGKILA